MFITKFNCYSIQAHFSDFQNIDIQKLNLFATNWYRCVAAHPTELNTTSSFFKKIKWDKVY
ncbi:MULTISPECIES: hypothetical protein [unclassified Okeania]|uniref:hypothetical protein n=1 Tax=unclassified Okeania TaxID=2634635 RepID=UPI0013B74062|nr:MULTISPECIES: hypothetical protein [unclassified Okeania]NES75389.1 hypothetical protein [Okeania sp. SIO1H4]NET19073.1 hypothetical protein [Okeania sp. SIO1H5]NET92846.1 hypothetical protein [Okeania sp. SIO1H2]